MSPILVLISTKNTNYSQSFKLCAGKAATWIIILLTSFTITENLAVKKILVFMPKSPIHAILIRDLICFTTRWTKLSSLQRAFLSSCIFFQHYFSMQACVWVILGMHALWCDFELWLFKKRDRNSQSSLSGVGSSTKAGSMKHFFDQTSNRYPDYQFEFAAQIGKLPMK